MNPFSIPVLRREGFSLEATVSRDEIRVKFSGNGDMETAPLLSNYLKQIHAEACRAGVSGVTFDFQELYFMNSSCFKSFVSWINLVNKMGPDARYLIRFITLQSLRWQSRSLEALRNFAPSLVSVEGGEIPH